jgi:hypothetical protein
VPGRQPGAVQSVTGQVGQRVEPAGVDAPPVAGGLGLSGQRVERGVDGGDRVGRPGGPQLGDPVRQRDRLHLPVGRLLFVAALRGGRVHGQHRPGQRLPQPAGGLPGRAGQHPPLHRGRLRVVEQRGGLVDHPGLDHVDPPGGQRGRGAGQPAQPHRQVHLRLPGPAADPERGGHLRRRAAQPLPVAGRLGLPPPGQLPDQAKPQPGRPRLQPGRRGDPVHQVRIGQHRRLGGHRGQKPGQVRAGRCGQVDRRLPAGPVHQRGELRVHVLRRHRIHHCFEHVFEGSRRSRQPVAPTRRTAIAAGEMPSTLGPDLA